MSTAARRGETGRALQKTASSASALWRPQALVRRTGLPMLLREVASLRSTSGESAGLSAFVGIPGQRSVSSMYLRRLELRDFRNWREVDISLLPGIVLFHGPNGAGKTNLLEAICVAALGESPRARETQEMVRRGKDYAFARAELQEADRSVRLEVGLARTGQRQFKVNGVRKRRADLIGLAPAVYFSADDIVVVKGEPGARRQMLDAELAAISQPYYFHLLRYRRSLEQRNRLLKEIRAGRQSAEALGPWDRAAARYGAHVIVGRGGFIAALAPEAARAHDLLTSRETGLVIEYRPSVGFPNGQSIDGSEEDKLLMADNISIRLESALRAERDTDIARGVTGSGPHRDDVELLLGGEPVRWFGSQGQQRICAVAIRLGVAAVVRRVVGESPLLLLDDVLSELDAHHRAGVLSACREAEQVAITCCDPSDVPQAVQAHAASFGVCDGQLI